MVIELDYNTKSIEVDETIVYQNNTGQPLTTLVLAVEPNLWWQCFTLEELHIDGVLVTDYLLDGQRFIEAWDDDRNLQLVHRPLGVNHGSLAGTYPTEARLQADKI